MSKKNKKQGDPKEDLATVAALLRESVQLNTRWRPKISPPIFTGKLEEDPSRFLKKMERLLEETTEDIEDYVDMVKAQLEGEAKKWFRPLDNLHLGWEQFKQRFLAHFNGSAALTRLNCALYSEAQKPTESGRDFVARKMALWNRESSRKDDQVAIQATVQLLRPDHRLALCGRQFNQLQELLDAVELVDAALADKSAEAKKEQRSICCSNCGGRHYHRDCPTASRDQGNA